MFFRRFRKLLSLICSVMMITFIFIPAEAEQEENRIRLSGDLYELNSTTAKALPAKVITVNNSGVINAEAATEVLFSQEERSKAIRAETDNVCYKRANKSFKATDIRVENNGNIEAEIFSYDGSFSYVRSVPDQWTRNDYESGYGVLSTDGAAAGCAISKDAALKMAEEVLAELNCPFEYRLYRVNAYSPTDDSYYTTGFYDVVFQQVINQVPVAVYNTLPYEEYQSEIRYIPENFYGVRVRVFEDGVYSIVCEWLTACSVLEEQPANMSLEQALEAFTKYFTDNPQADISPLPLQIDNICFEYAVTGEGASSYELIPCWSFTKAEDETRFYGLRINATDGSAILFYGCDI